MATKQIIYLSGPITGVENNNFQEFARAQEKLEALGHYVINPHEECNVIDPKAFETDAEYWQICMKICITRMMRANKVVTLDGWEKSKGANIEVDLARKINIDVQHIIPFLNGKS